MNSTPAVASTSFLSLVSQAGPMALMVLAILLVVSLMCWAVIFSKWRSLGRARRENDRFLETFRSGKTLAEVFSKSSSFADAPIAAVFRSGVTELNALSSDLKSLHPDAMNNVQRALIRASSEQISGFESSVGILATTASAAPFIGLFGTVWGIVNSFQNIGATGAANLAVVAPGISEALVATAAGIGAAIPAVVAYNYFAGQIRRQAVDMENFSQDFLNIVQRSMLGPRT